MRDILYVTATVAFFGLMLAYVSFCERMGRRSDADTTNSEMQR